MQSRGILQWNCRGLKPNLLELNVLMQTHNPMIICLQETYLEPNFIPSVSNYIYYNSYAKTSGTKVHGGVSILIHNSIPQSMVNIQTSLQAVVIRATYSNHTISICSLYLPPNEAFDIRELDRITNQMPSPIIVVGDFNAHNPIWGDKALDPRGRDIE